MKPIIICGVLLIATFSIIVFDFGRRVIECRKVNDSLTIRLADIDEHYWLFKRNP